MVQHIIRDFFEMDSVFFLNFGFSKSYGGGQFCLEGAIMISCSQGPLTVLAVENTLGLAVESKATADCSDCKTFNGPHCKGRARSFVDRIGLRAVKLRR